VLLDTLRRYQRVVRLRRQALLESVTDPGGEDKKPSKNEESRSDRRSRLASEHAQLRREIDELMLTEEL